MPRHPNQTNGYEVSRRSGTRANPTMPGESVRKRDLAQLAMVQEARPMESVPQRLKRLKAVARGESLGPVHWFPMHDYVLVSQKLYDQLKAASAHGR